MMHRCSSSQVGPCSCDHFHYYPHQYHHSSNSYSSSSSSPPSFSVLFSQPYDRHDRGDEMYSYGSSVDCTLSLGTPSTRSNDAVYNDDVGLKQRKEQRRSDSRVSNFCWDLLQPKTASSQHKSNVRGGHNGNNGNNNSDPLVARRCANCDTTSTPLWRNGPRGPKSLCNACGIRFKKEERRATAAAATPVMESPACHVSPPYGHVSQWNGLSQYSQPQKLFSATNDFRYVDASGDDMSHAGSDAGISFLSWHLNVTDRPSFVHDFTR